MNTSTSSNDVTTKWSVDPIHSNLSFKAKHLMLSIVTGWIKTFDLEVHTSGNDFGEVIDLKLAADMNTLSTNHEPRDKHLKSDDFFDVINHPFLRFQSILLDKQGMRPPSLLSVYRRDFKLHGMLTIKGTSRFVILDGEFGGISTASGAQKRAGFTIRGRISRKEFGLSWSGISDAGQLILADEVDIVGNILLVKQGL
jgi:polyisoprenoid-binding protein YceI